MLVVLQRGQRDCTGKVTVPQSSQRLPMSWGSSDGQVNTSARGFCIRSSSRRAVSSTSILTSIL